MPSFPEGAGLPDCDWCEESVSYSALRHIGPFELCVRCGQVAARWIDGKRPGTQSVGPTGARTFCHVCNWPLSGVSADYERDVASPGDDRPAHAGCVGTSDPRSETIAGP